MVAGDRLPEGLRNKIVEVYQLPIVGRVEIVQDDSPRQLHGEFYARNPSFLGNIGRFSNSVEQARKNAGYEIKAELERRRDSALELVKTISPVISDMSFEGNGWKGYQTPIKTGETQ